MIEGSCQINSTLCFSSVAQIVHICRHLRSRRGLSGGASRGSGGSKVGMYLYYYFSKVK